MKDIKLQMQKSIEDTLYYDKENAIDSILKIVFESILHEYNKLHVDKKVIKKWSLFNFILYFVDR